jgi:hypothetical protein
MILRDNSNLIRWNTDNAYQRSGWVGHVAVLPAVMLVARTCLQPQQQLLSTMPLSNRQTQSKLGLFARSNTSPPTGSISPFLTLFFSGWRVGAQEQTSASARFCRCVKGTFKCAIMMQSNAVQNDTSLHPSLGRAISTHARGHAGWRGREIIIPKNVH